MQNHIRIYSYDHVMILFNHSITLPYWEIPKKKSIFESIVTQHDVFFESNTSILCPFFVFLLD